MDSLFSVASFDWYCFTRLFLKKKAEVHGHVHHDARPSAATVREQIHMRLNTTAIIGDQPERHTETSKSPEQSP